MGAWQTSGSITSRAWSVVKLNPYLLGFPVAAAVTGIVAFLVFAGGGVVLLGLSTDEAGSTTQSAGSAAGYVLFAIGAYLAVLCTVFFTAGLTHCADSELRNRDSSFGEGVSRAFSRIGALLGWALIQTVVGWLLSLIRGNGSDNNIIVSILRAVLAGLLSVAWSLITFFVLPFIMLKQAGPIEAIKRSAALLKETWGNQLAGSIRIGFVVFLIGVLPGILAVVGGIFLTVAVSAAVGVPVIVLGALVIIVAQVFSSALRAVFGVALFHYAFDNTVVGPFTSAELQSAIKTR